ncbi:FkbM family methyltransferase [Dolichospermum sp. ST_sed3]|nr:FkbM family methyltransferase [Dolichospermum sp. ST_sed3]
MLKKIFKKLVPKNSFLFKAAFKVYDYKYWYPGKWQFDLLEAYATFKQHVTFIQVGSNNGITGDPIFPYITNYSWRGVLVEPVPYLFEELKNNYKSNAPNLIFENSAIADRNGQLKFYRLQKTDLPDMPIWYDQLGSFNKEVILRQKTVIPHFDDLLIEDIVNAITFETLLEKHTIEKTDLIHIDTEGYDFEILKLIPFYKLGVELIMFEHVHLSNTDYKSSLNMLAKNGFIYGRKNTDTIAVRKDIYSMLQKNKGR